jgi:hypothetical protein
MSVCACAWFYVPFCLGARALHFISVCVVTVRCSDSAVRVALAGSSPRTRSAQGTASARLQRRRYGASAAASRMTLGRNACSSSARQQRCTRTHTSSRHSVTSGACSSTDCAKRAENQVFPTCGSATRLQRGPQGVIRLDLCRAIPALEGAMLRVLQTIFCDESHSSRM